MHYLFSEDELCSHSTENEMDKHVTLRIHSTARVENIRPEMALITSKPIVDCDNRKCGWTRVSSQTREVEKRYKRPWKDKGEDTEEENSDEMGGVYGGWEKNRWLLMRIKEEDGWRNFMFSRETLKERDIRQGQRRGRPTGTGEHTAYKENNLETKQK